MYKKTVLVLSLPSPSLGIGIFESTPASLSSYAGVVAKEGLSRNMYMLSVAFYCMKEVSHLSIVYAIGHMTASDGMRQMRWESDKFSKHPAGRGRRCEDAGRGRGSAK